jgi:hypothetical protein
MGQLDHLKLAFKNNLRNPWRTAALICINLGIRTYLCYACLNAWLYNDDVNADSFWGQPNPTEDGVQYTFECWANTTMPEMVPKTFQNYNMYYISEHNADVGFYWTNEGTKGLNASVNVTQRFMMWFALGFFIFAVGIVSNLV